MKRIVDSVHGNIYIEDKYFQFIDTIYFQRLRRIEQSSIRSIFPCARHDRFSHSLGVFYMGKRISNQLEKEAIENHFYSMGDSDDQSKTKFLIIINSYLIACLLHDIAHAPFSHTFEKYYGRPKQLCDKLNASLEQPIQFEEDDYNRIKEHELVSATLVVDKFKDKINGEFQADCELVVRMIIGQQYKEEQLNKEQQIRNCFVSLLNGCIVDADRLDYASRDIWASGYKTASIDFERLISNIYIKESPATHKYEVCFSVDVVNEIQSLCEIKQFQSTHVFCHHTIMYEQYLFDKAAEKMMQLVEGGEEQGLQKIINYTTFTNKKHLTFHINNHDNHHNFYMVADEDLLFLMKQVPDNTYYEDWSKRNYTMHTLWETEDAFFYKCQRQTRFFGPKNHRLIHEIEAILQQNGFTNDQLYLIKPYARKNSPDILPIYVITHDGEVERYSNYKHIEEKAVPPEDYFYYVYVDKNIWNAKSNAEKDNIINSIGQKILEFCPEEN